MATARQAVRCIITLLWPRRVPDHKLIKPGLVMMAPRPPSKSHCLERSAARPAKVHGSKLALMSSRRGLSLIELLVVISILGLLMAIAIPVLGRAREASRHAQCKNHLRQLGVSLHNHTSQSGLFPRDGENGWGFGAFLLPALGESGLFNAIDPLASMIPSTSTATPGKTDPVIAVFLCPTLPAGERIPSGFGRSAYRGNRELFTKKTKPTDVHDGESATIACGETDIDHAWALPGLGTATDLPNGGGAFGSQHDGGATFVMCDGSVHFLAETIDTLTFAALCTKAGRDVAGEF